MGCCISRTDGPNSPYLGGAATASSHAINPSPSPAAASTALPGSNNHLASPTTASQRHHAPAHHRQPPLSQHINKPLRQHAWTSKDRTWSRAALARERADFFDTRVTGRPEAWQALRAALTELWAGDVATAQGILLAAEVTLPTGDLASGAYDALGNYYPLPEWIVADPGNVVERDEEEEGEAHEADVDKMTGEDTAEEGDLDEDEVLRRREEKGKAVLDVRDLITVRARLSEGGHDVHVSLGKQESVRSLARKALEESGLPSSKRIRIAYMGRILRDNMPLQEQGWQPGHVVNALVFNR